MSMCQIYIWLVWDAAQGQLKSRGLSSFVVPDKKEIR